MYRLHLLLKSQGTSQRFVLLPICFFLLIFAYNLKHKQAHECVTSGMYDSALQKSLCFFFASACFQPGNFAKSAALMPKTF
jgi:hypothetical protein